MHHVGHEKVLPVLAKRYFWPTMKTDCRKWLQNCATCENSKAARNEAHGMFSARPLTGPRTRYCVDFQGQGKAINGECEALGIIDSFTKTVSVIALPSRQATTLALPLCNEIFFRRGAADVLHSDAAPEFMGELLAQLSLILKFEGTDTKGHNARGNSEIEVWWRYWNRCLRILTPSQYQNWPDYTQRITFAHNTAPQASLGGSSPFELDAGVPARSPFDPPDPNHDWDGELPDYLANDHASCAQHVATSAAAFRALARDNGNYILVVPPPNA